MSKRGRPNVFEKYYGHDTDLKEGLLEYFPDKKDRALSNFLYQIHASNVISEAASKIGKRLQKNVGYPDFETPYMTDYRRIVLKSIEKPG